MDMIVLEFKGIDLDVVSPFNLFESFLADLFGSGVLEHIESALRNENQVIQIPS